MNTSVRNTPSQKKFRFIKRLTVSNADFDAKRSGYYRTCNYYGPTYDRTVVRSGIRYNDAYGPRYYTRTVYGDWY